jgi:hypothetical protein
MNKIKAVSIRKELSYYHIQYQYVIYEVLCVLLICEV